MRVSQEEKERSHARIVEAAARLLREHGIESASVGDVMSAAGLTHGGFYRHFETKEALVESALGAAFEQIIGGLEARLKRGEPAAAVDGFRTHYLSAGHVARPGVGCPVAALGSEIARGAAALKAAFGAGVRRMMAALGAGQAGNTPEEKSARAARELAMLVGAVVIARASDPATARAVLAACRRPSDDR